MLKKIERISDESTLDLFRGRPCVECGQSSDPCHIRSVGAGGDDVEWNLISICRQHHTEQHQIGWVTFARKYRSVHLALRLKGWQIEGEKLKRSHSN